MKRKLGPASILVLVLAGCSPAVRWAAAREGVTQTERALVSANSSGALKDKDFVATEAYVNASRTAVNLAGEELSANGKPDQSFDQYLDLAESTVKQLQAFTKKK